MIKTPYLLFLGDARDSLAAKVAQGIRDWRPEHCIGQFSMEGCQADVGLPELTIEQAIERGAQTLVVGVANRGGVISAPWLSVFEQSLAAGLDIASGLHNLLNNESALVDAARRYDRQLVDVRTATVQYPIGDGKRRGGKRCLAVGTDCSVGKMYTALAMERVMRERELKATFRATGQTGILITGEGVPLDAVIADFMAGSVEWLTPDNDPDHWDLIEGQGSLFHPSYSGVTMALLHGGSPDALILCHEPTRQNMRGLPHFPLPELKQLNDLALSIAQVVNPDCAVTGISVNTSGLSESAADSYLQTLEAEFQLPAVDPFRQSANRLVDSLLQL